MRACILCGYAERRGSTVAGYVICSRCVTSLMVMSPESKRELYERLLENAPDAAQALKDNFVIHSQARRAESANLIEAVKARGVRKVARLSGLPQSTVARWIKDGRVPEAHIANVSHAVSG